MTTSLSPSTESQTDAFERDLRAAMRGAVYFDATRRGIYATDASIYQIDPVAVCVPLDEQDVRAAIAIADQHGVSILPRGAGTSLAGQAVGASLVIDVSKHMNCVLEVNAEQRWARVQPGVVRDSLNAELRQHGLHYAPDPATSSRANIGGMLGNNSAGMRSIVYGKTIDHAVASRVLLADGTLLEVSELDSDAFAQKASQQDREGEIYRGFREIIAANRDEIMRRYPKVMRRCGGYNLDEFVRTDRWNLAKLLVGSEGTLGLTLEAKINLEPIPAHTCVCIAHFADLLEAIRAVEPIVNHGPSAVEILDNRVITLARRNLSTRPLCDFLEGDPPAVLIVEFFGETPADARRKIDQVIADLQARGTGYAFPIRDDAAGMNRVWTVRKNGLGLMLGMKGDRKPMPFIEDAALPLDVLPEYIERVLAFCTKLETEVAMYAHASVGLIHVRPILDLRRQDDIERMVAISEHAFELVKGYGGSWAGEHGDGLSRSYYMERFFGTQLYHAFKDVKRLFDPKGLMNPGKIVDAPPIDQNLRFGAEYQTPEFMTDFRFGDDGGFHAAVEMCSGIGTCRQTLAGKMCPSYRATRDEEASTRGRANALRLAMSGQLGPDGMVSKHLHDVLDLCLSCKACKSECPSNVDMAKLKSEFLQRYRDHHGTTMRDRLIGGSRRAAERTSGWKAPLVNWMQGTRPFRWLLERLAGFDRRRTLPSTARETLVKWFAQRPPPDVGSDQRVVLFADTYANYYEPNVGRAAVELLESCGYEVVLADVGCCQRPRISHGFLREAARDGLLTLCQLDEPIAQGLPVVVLEPSCASALTDDLPDLIDNPALAKRIRENVFMIDVFLDDERRAGRLKANLRSPHQKLLIHEHCHQKSLYGTESMSNLLAEVPGLEVETLDTGCCGMAGSFGYETEHYDLSLRIGEDRLFPAIRNKADSTAIVSCGFSCRHQIAHATGGRPLHWVETLRGGDSARPHQAAQ
jgi:FAD/FMN-containing dehydrogenase/Fe-S oxidoreductase